MWRVVAILALTLSGCVSTKSAGQGPEIAYFMASPAMDFWEGLFIGYLITVLWLVFIYWLVSQSLPCVAPQSRSQYQSAGQKFFGSSASIGMAEEKVGMARLAKLAPTSQVMAEK